MQCSPLSHSIVCRLLSQGALRVTLWRPREPILTRSNRPIQETLRIMPVSAEGTAVTMDKDVDVCGYTIPAGTLIWCGQRLTHRVLTPWPSNKPRRSSSPPLHPCRMPFFVIHRHPQLWDSPEAFRPERWLESTDNPDAHPKLAPTYCPFSQGPRSCAGQNMAEMNYKAILATVWGRYTFKPTKEVRGNGWAGRSIGCARNGAGDCLAPKPQPSLYDPHNGRTL